MAHAGGYIPAVRMASIDIWSAYTTQVQLTIVAADKTLPSLTIVGVPSNATVTRALLLVKVRIVDNTNGAINSVSGAQNIQVQAAVGGSWITGIALAGGEFSTSALTREAGDVLMGGQDISAQIPANGSVLSVKWALALAALNNLNFDDIQSGVRLWYTV
jgi:hypothetical protein